jgi:hypothetical protein
MRRPRFEVSIYFYSGLLLLLLLVVVVVEVVVVLVVVVVVVEKERVVPLWSLKTRNLYRCIVSPRYFKMGLRYYAKLGLGY